METLHFTKKMKNYDVQGERRNELKPCLMHPTEYQ
jgi:hypothetical protein